jgi:sortase A
VTRRQRALRTIERISFGLGVLCLGAYSLGKGEAWLFAVRQEAWLGVATTPSRPSRALTDEAGAAPRASLRETAAWEEAWGLIEVPRISVRAFVAEGVDKKTLRVAVGHVPHTAFPDEIGNVGLAGHRDTVFLPLAQLVVGDVVTLTTPAAIYDYRIETIEIVEPTRVDVLNPSTERLLTLVTCYPFDVLGPAPLRMVARGRLLPRS